MSDRATNVVELPVWRSTFQPDGDAATMSAMREAFLARRSELAIAALRDGDAFLQGRGLGSLPTGLLGDLGNRAPMAGATAEVVFDDPVFAIWLRFLLRATASGRSDEADMHLAQLPSVLADVERRVTGKAESYVPGTLIAVERWSLHPYVHAAAPPSYDFTGKTAPAEDTAAPGHPMRLQADVVGFALDRVRAGWPAMAEQIDEYVRVIGYLPDGTFRSCSAARYAGIILLGNLDESVLDIEESLVHEAGHQVLYRLGEMTPLVERGTPVTAGYTLPWSGSRRDLFGYFHAYFIYVLLTKYFWRRGKMGDRYARDFQLRAMLIMASNHQAAHELAADRGLTPQARMIVGMLAVEMDELHAEMREAFPADEKEAAHG
ncbi:aKG-HExxH-type peptide beta-hydroxylase [Novosphingobium album (ex Hu et al. 2023)]|uniref:HEXXH motif-containing putative peptide modification protein n=1 Tax=Novosphingobium album (ex Hu et al. 2023) TaxID=2930093 RepID=A0ABT0B7R1_9SPHN|nr:HEXXH motif-containing putative peptide modification protein [Novosphingobium album (ex Hu et al. 2023)]MCJ2181067.1 HEXXH motif-containing putative peptide modification protein [Novosphingobium album (ex Hu et al. 2023)]